MIPFNHFALLISASFGSKVIQCKKIGYVQFLHHIFAVNKNIVTIFREEPNGRECLLSTWKNGTNTWQLLVLNLPLISIIITSIFYVNSTLEYSLPAEWT